MATTLLRSLRLRLNPDDGAIKGDEEAVHDMPSFTDEPEAKPPPPPLLSPVVTAWCEVGILL